MSTDATIATDTTSDDELEIVVGTDGETLPTQEVVTGRGFITGKSGSGKSNSVNVVLEELLEVGLPALVVDSEGEYWPLKEEYDVLHLGDGAECDGPVTDENARRVAHMALEEGVPIVMDVSEFDDERANDVIESVVRALFAKARRVKRPYLLVVEEIHEYLPQKGKDDLSELLTKVAKRGRKHGLGLLGASQRPSSVDKDYITQANWTVWHRLTYETDTKKVGKNLGKEYEEPVSSLDDGEAFLQGDWNDHVSTFRFRQKLTTDAGATPDVAPYVQTPISHDTDSLLDELGTTSESDGGDDAGDAPECPGGCECAELARRADALETTLIDRDVMLVRKVRRVDELKETVTALRERILGGDVERDATTLGVEGHKKAIHMVVSRYTAVQMGELYDEYCVLVDDPATKRTVRRYLETLSEEGLIGFSGERSARQYYPTARADGTLGNRENETRLLESELEETKQELEKTQDKLNGVRSALAHKNQRIENLETRLGVRVETSQDECNAARNEHQEVAREIVHSRFGTGPADVYAEYNARVNSPRSDRTVRRYLENLQKSEEVVFSGENKGRKYYPAPTGVDLPDDVTPADVVASIDNADTVLEVQRELGISRERTEGLLDGFDVDVGLETHTPAITPQ